MSDRKIVRFLEEIAGKDKLKISFPLTEYMQWAGIPLNDVDSVFTDVNRLLYVYFEKRTCTRIVTSFTTIGTVIEVEFGEWTKDVRDEEGWLLGLLRK